MGSVKDFFTERDLEHSPFQESEAFGSNTTGREDLWPEEPNVLSAEDQPGRTEHSLDRAQAAPEWLAPSEKKPKPTPDLFCSIWIRIRRWTWKAEQTDERERIPNLEDVPVEQLGEDDLLVRAHIASSISLAGPDVLSETDWRIEEDGTESKIHIGQDQDGYDYAVERSPAHGPGRRSPLARTIPDRRRSSNAPPYGGEHHVDARSLPLLGKRNQAVPSIPETQSSQVLDEVPGSGEQEQEEPSR